MGHHHDHHVANYNRAFALGVLFNGGYIVVEVVYGLMVGSLALLADAGHNLSDLLGLLLAWGAHYLTQLQPTQQRTYGWRSSSILAALGNALILLVALGAMAWEAVRRLAEPSPVAAGTVMIVAGIGVVINTATALLFMSGSKDDLNIRGAFLHMAADAGVSAGVVIAGLLIQQTGAMWIDPVVSLLIAAVIFLGTWGLLRDSVNLALQAVPRGIDAGEVREYLTGLAPVTELHDLHIWAMSTTEPVLTAHLVCPDLHATDEFLCDVTEQLHDRFGIEHVTIQVERNGGANACRQAAPGSV